MKTQKEMIELFQKEPNTYFYSKVGTFKARKGALGEYIETIIDGELETTKVVGPNEVVIEGPLGELYVVPESKFNKRYVVTTSLTEEMQPYTTKGLIRAFKWEGQSFKFVASWGEEMLCNHNDILATPVESKDDETVSEVYRIEQNVFDITYNLL